MHDRWLDDMNHLDMKFHSSVLFSHVNSPNIHPFIRAHLDVRALQLTPMYESHFLRRPRPLILLPSEPVSHRGLLVQSSLTNGPFQFNVAAVVLQCTNSSSTLTGPKVLVTISRLALLLSVIKYRWLSLTIYLLRIRG